MGSNTQVVVVLSNVLNCILSHYENELFTPFKILLTFLNPHASTELTVQ